MNRLDKIRKIKEILDVDIFEFTQIAGLDVNDIKKMEAIIYKDNVYIDSDEVNRIFEAIKNTVKRKHSTLNWEISELENKLNQKDETKENLDEAIIVLNQSTYIDSGFLF